MHCLEQELCWSIETEKIRLGIYFNIAYIFPTEHDDPDSEPS